MVIDREQPIFPLQLVAIATFDLSVDWLSSCRCSILIFDSAFDSLFFQFLLLEVAYFFKLLDFVDSDSKLVVLVPQLRPSDCAAANFETASISWPQHINQRLSSLKYAYPNS